MTYQERIAPEVFDDADRMAVTGIDLDVFDAMRDLVGRAEAGKLDLDDRDAVEAVIYVPDACRCIPETLRRYVDLSIRSAKANIAAGGLKRFEDGSIRGFVCRPTKL